MLELTLVKGGLFHHALEAILDLSDVAHVECTTSGLNLRTVDTERAAIVSLFFPAENLPDYICDEDISMGIPIDKLVKAIRCGLDNDTIKLKVGEENFENITLSFVVSPGNTLDYDVSLLDSERLHVELPDWQVLRADYQGSVKMPSVEFRQICNYLSNFGEDGLISVTDESLTFFAKGTCGIVYMEYKQSEQDTTTFKIDMKEAIRLTFDLKHLNTFANVFTLSGQVDGQVTLFLSKTYPLVVEYIIGRKGHIKCFVASEMETEKKEDAKESRKRDKKNRKSQEENGTEEEDVMVNKNSKSLEKSPAENRTKEEDAMLIAKQE